ncbi:MAG: FtsX-like permease family protein, partial [Chthoniobacterales bacterium]
MNTRWRKIAGDFRAHRLQIALIGIVLASGAAGTIAALNTRAVLQREIARSYASAQSPDIALWFEKVDAPLLEKVRAQPGVAAVDSRRVVFSRIAGSGNQWFLMRLTVLRDFASQQLGKIHRDDGAPWPNESNGIFIEQSGRSLLHTEVGAQLRVRTPGGEIVTVPCVGFVHDTTVAPSTQDRAIYGYVTPATAALLGQNATLDQLVVKLTARGDSGDTASFAEDLRDWLKANGENPLRAEALSNSHPHAILMSTMLRVLQAFAAMAFACSAALVLYMLSLWMKREARQVGIMKTLGARSHQLAAQYLGLVAPLVLVANAIAWPIGVSLGRSLVRYYQHAFNIDVVDWGTPSSLVTKELLFTLGLPFFAMAVPIVRAARMTALRAIQDPGITTPRRAPLSLTKLLKLPGNRRWTFALRNTFRRPGRLAITLVALSLGGALLLTANNTYESLMRVVDVSLGNQGHDIQAQLQRPASTDELAKIVRKIPEAEIAEPWRSAPITMATSHGKESPRVSLLGYPGETRLFKLPTQEGRLSRPDETDAIILNRLAQEALDGIRVGSELELRYRDRLTTARVVGIVEEIGAPTVYANYATFEAVTGLGDGSLLLRVKTTPGALESVAARLDQALLDAHLPATHIYTRGEFRSSLEEHFATVTDVMRIVALAAALLGAISLAASAGLNVVERAREIGVVRALGATGRTVNAMFLIESGAVVALSAAISFALAVIFTRGLNQMAEHELLHVAVPLHISLTGLTLLTSGF